MKLRRGNINDLRELASIESICFPPEQAAGLEQFRRRLEKYPQHFLVLCDSDGKIISFINGFVTDIPDLTDEMYEKADMHKENGSWQMIFGLNTLPEYRRRGHAQTLMNEFLSIARSEGRRGAVLTCKESLIGFYERFGFVNEGVSEGSVIGGVKWYQMRRSF
ncbi:GNAT family N-acetyltransferase [uncultured Ruminococcus sp.]|uniref:GNAT family N-acetyltransferase n=1 Tax=uncultured Ruminococcus sp. TaxID=165186 RepID=UPI0025F82C29|nr:N-acetyltransferase [uncultured Ruminococcus sp.]